MKLFSASKDLLKFDFLGRLLAQNHASIVSVNVLGCEVLKRVDFGQLLDILVAVDKDWFDDVMFAVSDVAEGENFLEVEPSIILLA